MTATKTGSPATGGPETGDSAIGHTATGDSATGNAGRLDARYGRTPAKRRRDRWIAGIVAAAFVAVFACWVVWVGLGSPAASINASDTGYKILDQYSVRVNYSVSIPRGSTASCALQAQNKDHSIVGWKIVPVPASAQTTRSYSETVRTSELAVTGLIYQCWVT